MKNNSIDKTRIGKFYISTVFLCINHALFYGEEPVLYETMVFYEDSDYSMYRYSTREEAIAGHEQRIIEVQTYLRENAEYESLKMFIILGLTVSLLLIYLIR
ncbi:hypothetical protein [Scytonema sp. NUACC26]|uniref:hypothetical protein n=1 Tax=Scytonema sp. NUACC26 TaxID=3140176 RepID=UPI0034DBCF73